MTRFTAESLALAFGLAATALFMNMNGAGDVRPITVALGALLFIMTTWLSWGAVLGLVGLAARRKDQFHPAQTADPITSRTAILFPIYNEEPSTSFARVAAMDAALAKLGYADHFDFAILSDTTDPQIAAEEEDWYIHLVRARDATGRIFYCRRIENIGRKACNIRVLIQNSGAAYDFALILNADSLMEPETIVEMARRMQAAPSLGLLQTLPTIVNAQSVFGRVMQFAASFYSPYFTRGLEVMQGTSGYFWGHNAMVRVTAFAQACGLPKLEGKAPFGGHILSHEYVEAALLARDGWTVRVDTDLAGSFEEGPEDIIAYAKRDRRWCQGNIQHTAIIAAPHLLGWSRFVLAQGVMTYAAPILWMLFILGSIYAAATGASVPLPSEGATVATSGTTNTVLLILGIAGLLFLPKLLILVSSVFTRRATQFGGGARAAFSTLTEVLLSSILAPVIQGV